MTVLEARQFLAAEEATYQRVRSTLGPDGLDYWVRRLFTARAVLTNAERIALRDSMPVERAQQSVERARRPATKAKPRTGTKTRHNASQSERRISVRGKGTK
jgi:hypothetical protein